MEQKPLILVYKEVEEDLIKAINKGMNAGLPIFTLEPLVRLVLKEAQAQIEVERAKAAASSTQEKTNETAES